MIWATIVMALREIRRNTMRSMLTTLGIVIGVASVIAMVTLGRAVTERVTTEISNMGTNLLILVPGAQRHGPASAGATPFKMEDARAVSREIKAVDKVAPSASKSLLIVSGNQNWNTSVTGSNNDYLEVRNYKLMRGGHGFTDAQLQAGMPVCILGATVKKELFGPQDAIGSVIRVGSVSCTVLGVTEAKGKSAFGPDQDDFVVMPLSTFQRRISGNNDVTVIFISAATPRLITKAKDQIEVLMRERRRVAAGQSNDFSVEDIKEMSNTLGSVTGVLTALLGAIAGVSLLVGGIGIMNIMLVSVTERTREIGIRLSIGARAREVLLQFLIEAITLSIFGGAVGIVLGLSLSFVATQMMNLPFRILPGIVVVAFGFSAAVGIAFGYFPARKASKLNPIEALRHE